MGVSPRLVRRAPACVRVRRGLRGVVIALGLISLALADAALAGPRSHARPAAPDPDPIPVVAVAAPNLRLAVAHRFFSQDGIETYAPAPTRTLSEGDHEGHGVHGEIVGTLPIAGPLGARLRLHGDRGERQRSLDGLGRGNTAYTTYGADATLLLRNPAFGALEAGGGYARVVRDSSPEADEYRAHGALSIFYPDLGLGAVDWVLRFDYAHRQISGIVSAVDLDADRYAVTGEAGWYAAENLRIAFGGRFRRAENEFSSEDDREGFVRVRWWLGRLLPVAVPAELSFGGSAGVSEYKQSPFRADRRAVYRAEVGLVLRFNSGASLLESIRRYD